MAYYNSTRSGCGLCRKYPLLLCLLVINIIGAVAVLCLAGWLIDASESPFIAGTLVESMAAAEVEGSKEQLSRRNDSELVASKMKELYILTLVVGTLLICPGIILIWNAVDTLILLSPAFGCHNSCWPMSCYRAKLLGEVLTIVDKAKRDVHI